MSLREDMLKYEQITGESAEHVPIIKLGAFLDGYDMGIKALEQTRPKGKWIIRPDRASDIEYRCSECGKIQFADDTNELNYCCNCGSKMEVSE